MDLGTYGHFAQVVLRLVLDCEHGEGPACGHPLAQER